MEESVFENSPFSSSEPANTNGSKKNRGKRLIFLLIVLIIIGGLIYGGIKVAGNVFSTPTPTPVPTEAPLPTDTPTPTVDEELTPSVTPKVTAKPTTATTATPTKAAATDSVDKTTGLDRADITLTVQNGSGEAGVAKTMADKLTGLGYNVSGTGNADNFDYANTVIKVTSANSKFLALLKKDLGTDYTIDSTSAADYAGTGDGVVIVGKN